MRKRRSENNVPVGEKIADALELPREVAVNMPRVTVWADRETEILNHKGIIEYDDMIIRLNTSAGIITITGERLDIKSITDDDISVTGKIKKIEM